LKIDSGVLRALLHTHCFKHGVRSMESLVAMSSLSGKDSFERSALPGEVQLDLHVDGREFLALVQQMDLDGDLLEKLAQSVHGLFCEDLRMRGYRPGPTTADKPKQHSSLRPYAELPEDEKEQNRGNVRDIASKLARIGYVMIPARSNQSIINFPSNDLEMLAEIEHERWMKSKIEAGWRYAKKTDKPRKLHKDIVPWRRLSAKERASLYSPAECVAIGPLMLSEAEKQKDRILVQGIPQILARGGYTVVKVQSTGSKE
jgi:hypothetical protein